MGPMDAARLCTYSRTMNPEGADQPGPAAVDLTELEALVGYRLRRAHLAVLQDFQRGFADLGIRPGQYSVLITLSSQPGLRQSQLADALGIKRANLVILLDELQQRGLVQRLPSASDRRAVSLHLTEAGHALAADLRVQQAEHEARIAAQLGNPQDRAALLEILGRLAGL